MTGDAVDRTTAYAEAVTAGEIVAGPHVRNACERHLRDLEHGPDRGLRWNAPQADRLHRYFPTVLRLAGGRWEGQPFELLPWEAFVVGSLFGWQTWSDEHQDWLRRFRVAYVETGKGSGKTPLAAGIGMYMLTADDEPRAEVYAGATKKDQAMVLFRDAVAMVDQSPALARRITKSGGNPVWNLAVVETGSFFRPISNDDGQSGPRPHCGLLDEVHEHKDARMIGAMRDGVKSRRQPLTLMITNSGVDRQSVCYEQHEYATKVAAGDITDDEYFAYVCEKDDGEDPLNDEDDPELGYPRTWLKTNPSLPHGLPGIGYLRGQVREARGMPSKQARVRRINFCEWVDAANPWIDGDLWRACEVDDLEIEAGRPLCLALDLSGKLDLTAMAGVSPDGEGGLDAWVRFWTPADTLRKREARDRVPYWTWKEQGHLEATPGKSIDYAYVAGEVAALQERHEIVALAFDPYRMEDFARELDEVGVPYRYWRGPDKPPEGRDGILLVKHGQGFGGGASESSLWMPRSIETLEDAVLAEQLRVRTNPVLRWNSASAVIQQDAQGNKKWEKRKSTGRIDGIVALSMAAGLADIVETAPAPKRKWLLCVSS